MTRKDGSKDNTAAIAAAYGVSLKSLRLYEKLGMLVPPRSQAGWRVYGKGEIDRLLVIQTLKRLGLAISRIAVLLKADKDNFDTLLAEQAELLHEQRRQVALAIDLVRLTRARLRSGRASSPDDLAHLARRDQERIVPFTPAVAPLIEKVFTPDDQAALHSAAYDDATAMRLSEGWAQIHADARALAPGGDAASAGALDMARRMRDLILLMTKGDEAFARRATQFWVMAFENPEIAKQMPITKAEWEFLHAAAAALREREGQEG
ncbi:MAG: MerR family transcriptional regulator [Rhizomicrobium sp.]